MRSRSPFHRLAAVNSLSGDAGAKLSSGVAASSSHNDAASLHANAIALGETGVLIRGGSGAGKSSLAATLIAAVRQAGRFAALIGDDRIRLSLQNGRLVARGHPAIRGMIELRGQGIVPMPHEPAAIVRLVVDLLPEADIARYPDDNDREIALCGAKVSRLALPKGRSSSDCAVLVMMYLQHAGIF
ncbi:MAG: hypothetical protein EPN75_13060 [Beijerinckiaceae bacterium]|nr:MAG: hypothetical protein EPN75_13060 [Beijerinckiaceae bacterium]